jgi:hypothetical protein
MEEEEYDIKKDYHGAKEYKSEEDFLSSALSFFSYIKEDTKKHDEEE